MGQALPDLLHLWRGEQGAGEFLVWSPLCHPVDDIHGALIGRSGALQVSLPLIQFAQGLVVCQRGGGLPIS